jgi:hypothetical protein
MATLTSGMEKLEFGQGRERFTAYVSLIQCEWWIYSDRAANHLIGIIYERSGPGPYYLAQLRGGRTRLMEGIQSRNAAILSLYCTWLQTGGAT